MNATPISTAAVAIPVEPDDNDHLAVQISDFAWQSYAVESVGDVPVASSARLATLRPEDESFLRQSEYITISIFKVRPRSYTGITFTEDEDKVVRVKDVLESSPFQTTPLRSGDAVVSVNQFQITSAKLAERLVKTLDFWVTLIVQPTNSNSNFVSTILKKHVPDQRLGIHFTKSPNRPVCIANLDTRGVLAHTSLLQVGDAVHAINGQGVDTEQHAVEALSSNPEQVELVTASPQGVLLVFRAAPLRCSITGTCLCLAISLIVIVVLVAYFVAADQH
ncbi:hypothetical protein MHU86_8596 [Fragilaria crotonensis]|nr:hypothetical protein MHU86_8596 [Fragilaria crotonensis]